MEIIEEIKQKLGGKSKNIFEKNPHRYYIHILPEDIVESSRILFSDMKCRFMTATGIDTREGIEILYHFSHDRTGVIYTLKALISNRNKPEIDSIAGLFRGAGWIEREIHEMLGVNFRNNRNLGHLLLADDWPAGKYPLKQEKKDN